MSSFISKNRVVFGVALAGAAVSIALALYNASDKSRKKSDVVAIIVDNGSYRPASTLSLRDMAVKVAAQTGVPVVPASASFSDKVPPDQLNGVPAEVLETTITRLIFEGGVKQLVFLPAFLGPSYVLHKVIPKTMTDVIAKLGLPAGAVTYTVARPLVDVSDVNDNRIAAVLVDNAMTAIRNASLTAPAVAVCDHGSPSAAVSAVRDHVAAQATPLLQAAAQQAGITLRGVAPCSMERRPEPEYDFNNPLLEALLRTRPVFNNGQVVVALLFLSPGKHAGAGGDISGMIGEAEKEAAQAGSALKCVKTTLLGAHPGTIAVLVDRLQEAVARLRDGHTGLVKAQ